MSGFLVDIFRPSCLTDGLFRVMVDRIASFFNDSGATWAVGLDVSAETYYKSY